MYVLTTASDLKVERAATPVHKKAAVPRSETVECPRGGSGAFDVTGNRPGYV